MKKLLLFIAFISICVVSWAQEPLHVDAGEDKHFCPYGVTYDSVYLSVGGLPTVTGGTPPYTYRWFTNEPVVSIINNYWASDMLDDTASANPFIVSAIESNEVYGKVQLYLEVTDSNGMVAMDSMKFTHSTFFIHLGSFHVYAEHGDTIKITPVASSSYPLVKWQWTDSTDFIDPASSAKPRIFCQYGSTKSSYAVVVYDSMNCFMPTVSNESIFVYPLQVEEMTSNRPELIVFPNPVEDKFQLNFAQNTAIQIDKLVDVQGKSIQLDSPAAGFFDVSHLSQGIYFLHLNHLGKAHVVRIVKN